MNFKNTIEVIVMIFEIGGVIALIIGAIFALIKYIGDLPRRREDAPAVYRQLRRGLGRAILIGLEFLVAADIIRSIAVDPTFTSVGDAANNICGNQELQP